MFSVCALQATSELCKHILNSTFIYIDTNKCCIQLHLSHVYYTKLNLVLEILIILMDIRHIVVVLFTRHFIEYPAIETTCSINNIYVFLTTVIIYCIINYMALD